MSQVGIEKDPCPSTSPDGDRCMRAAEHLDAHRRDTDGRQWTGGAFRHAAWVEVPTRGPLTGAWRIVSY